MAWLYGGWRRESGLAAQRAMLILHIEEVEAMLSGFAEQESLGMRGQRHNQTEYRQDLEKRLEELDDKIAAANATDMNPFFGVRPTA